MDHNQEVMEPARMDDRDETPKPEKQSTKAQQESNFLDDWDDVDAGATKEFDDLPYSEGENTPVSPPLEPSDGHETGSDAPVVLEPEKPSSRSIKRAIDVITRTALVEQVMPESEVTHSRNAPDTPWVLEQFFNGDIDLDVELSTRFSSMPLMSTVKFREVGTKRKRGVATLAAADGSAQMILDVDAHNHVIQLSFTLGSMLTLRFSLNDLSAPDRERYLDLMRRSEGGLAFLWGPSRWEKDYIICVARRYFTNFYAFSASNFDAAIRLTPDVTRELLEWLQGYWSKTESDQDEPPLLTW